MWDYVICVHFYMNISLRAIIVSIIERAPYISFLHENPKMLHENPIISMVSALREVSVTYRWYGYLRTPAYQCLQDDSNTYFYARTRFHDQTNRRIYQADLKSTTHRLISSSQIRFERLHSTKAASVEIRA